MFHQFACCPSTTAYTWSTWLDISKLALFPQMLCSPGWNPWSLVTNIVSSYKSLSFIAYKRSLTRIQWKKYKRNMLPLNLQLLRCSVYFVVCQSKVVDQYLTDVLGQLNPEKGADAKSLGTNLLSDTWPLPPCLSKNSSGAIRERCGNMNPTARKKLLLFRRCIQSIAFFVISLPIKFLSISLSLTARYLSLFWALQ